METLVFKERVQNSTFTPSISTFSAAVAGKQYLPLKRADDSKRQVIQVADSDGKVVNIILSKTLTEEFVNGRTSLGELSNCEVHVRQTENPVTHVMENWYLLQRPAGAGGQWINGDKYNELEAAPYTASIPATFSLKNVKDLTELI